MQSFKLWFENIEPFPQYTRTFLWKKNRTWKKLLNQEPVITLNHYRDLLKQHGSVRATYLGDYLLNVIINSILSQVFSKELIGSHPSPDKFIETIKSSLKTISTPEEALYETEQLYDGNHPVMVQNYQFNIKSLVYLNYDPNKYYN